MFTHKIIFGLAAGCFALAVIAAVPQVVLAHRSGCHNLHTCPSDTGAYVCGDLGYPCDGSTSAKQVSIKAINVPMVIDKAFTETFGRKTTEAESAYWKNRFRNDKDGLYKIRKTMAWHKTKGSFGPAAPTSIVAGFFRAVYGRDPSLTENAYWVTRIKDKPTEPAMKDTMLFHKANNIRH